MTPTRPEPTHVLIPASTHNSNRRCHLPRATDENRPKCGADTKSHRSFRRVPADHPAADKPLCKNCTGDVERAETPTRSLRSLVAAGEIDAAEVFDD